jgi:hypothetical protein
MHQTKNLKFYDGMTNPGTSKCAVWMVGLSPIQTRAEPDSGS